MVKVVTVRDFRDRAAEVLRSTDLVLVTRDGTPAGFYVPWDAAELPDELRREVLRELAARVRRDVDVAGVSEREILDDFAALRGRR